MYKKLTGILSPREGDTLWRYLSFEKFANILSKKSLYFARTDTFEDPYEGSIPPLLREIYKQETDHLGNTGGQAVRELWENWRKWVMCCCWHRDKHESMAMWGRYDLHNSGIVIKTTMQGLKNSFTSKEGVDVYIGKIRYINHQDFKVPQNILDMNTIYLPFFYKRKAFKYENEVRAIIDASPYIKEDFFRVKKEPDIDRNAINLQQLLKIEYPKIEKKGQNLKVNLNMLIDEVIISPYAKDWVTETVKSVVRQYGFQFPVSRSILLDPPD